MGGRTQTDHRVLVGKRTKNPILLELLPDACLAMAEQLLGRGTLLQTQTLAVAEGEPMVGKYCRGCYCNFPKPEGSPRSIKDGHT